jgi:hypothetical protein
MRTIMFVFLALAITTAATADLGNTYVKIDIPSNPGTPDGREGGETVDDAVVISALPYSDTGNTSDNHHDYEEVCPYTGSLSPDVVYAFTPAADGAIDIDLCESGYDTKLFVYENVATPGNPYACNDDADCDLSYRSALLNLAVTGGNTYYIVIDGYGSESGDYLITVNEAAPPPPPCVLECPVGGVHEGEPTIEDGYVDNYNGGCGSSPTIFQLIDVPVLCAKSGWYTYSGGGSSRDTDWFTVIADDTGYITVNTFAEYDLFIFVLGPIDCNSVGVVYQATATCDIPGTIEYSHPAGTECWLWAGPTAFDGPVYEFDYIQTITGIEFADPTPIESNSWGSIKQQYRN